MSYFMNLIETGLQQKSENKTLSDLGLRSQYVGASDLPKCIRQVVLNKLDQPEYDLSSLIRMRRGDIAENILVAGLEASGVSLISKQTTGKQFSLEETIDDVPYKAHLDVLVQYDVDGVMYYGVVECKSISDNVPNTPNKDHIEQLNFGMALLSRKYPEAHVFGSLFVVNVQSGKCGFFDHETSDEIFTQSLNKGSMIWNYLQSYKAGEIESVDIPCRVGVQCSSCDFIMDCPRYEGEEVAELLPVFEEAIGYKDEEKKNKQSYDSIKSTLASILEGRGINVVKSGSFIVRKSDRAKDSYDMVEIAKKLAEQGDSLDNYESKNAYSVVEIRRASKKKGKKTKNEE